MSEGKKRHSAGWYAGALAFWLIAFWLVGVGLSSIIPQIFWPEVSAEARAKGSCAETVRVLEQELLEHVSHAFGEVPLTATRDELSAWLGEWDRRHQGVGPACSPREHQAWVELGRLRFGLTGLLDRFDQEQLPRIRKIEQTLGPARVGGQQKP